VTDFAALEKGLGISFADKNILLNALVHSSYVNENPDYISNERLEFLGDAVLGLVMAERLYRLLPGAGEGELTQKRAALISRESLTRLARGTGLGEYLLLGRGEEATKGRSKPANLSGAMEAVIAAVYLDGGSQTVRDWILGLMSDEITRVALAARDADYKSELQELTQARGWGTPVYKPAGQVGPDHARLFTVEVFFEGRQVATGTGKTKKAAETAAAQNALGLLRNEAWR
jgi:ribonuclease-3